MQVTVSIPATSANIGPGFDVWGMALRLRNEFTARFRSDTDGSLCRVTWDTISIAADLETREGKSALPATDDNLVCQSYRNLMQEAGVAPIPLDLHITIRIPLERGLGSSSTAILAGKTIANEALREFYGRPYSMDELFNIAVKAEGHPDNLAPALFGGWILSLLDANAGSYYPFSLPVRAPVQIAGVIPAIKLSTEKARQVIAKEYSFDTLIFQQSRTALLPHLLSRPEWTMADEEGFRLAMEEKIHQEQRATFIPGMRETFAYWKSLGAYGSYLSGAGTTLLAFWPKDADPLSLHLAAEFSSRNIDAIPFRADIDREGLTITKA